MRTRSFVVCVAAAAFGAALIAYGFLKSGGADYVAVTIGAVVLVLFAGFAAGVQRLAFTAKAPVLHKDVEAALSVERVPDADDDDDVNQVEKA